jgi:acylphosphatase
MDVYTAANAHIYLQKAAQHNPIQYSLAGRLQYSQSGWLTLTVPAALVRGAFDALHEQGAEPPQILAIPIMSPTELSKVGGPDKVTERGHSFQYTLGPVRSNDPGKDGLSKTWYIQIFSPELKKLRHSYGLEPYIKGTHCFQLPIAVRKTGVFKPDDDVVKTSEYLKEPDWRDYDPKVVEKAAEDISPQTYLFRGDVQGVGLRKVLHQIMDQRKAEGLAYNDARNNQTLVTLGGNPAVRERVLRELHNYLNSRDAQYSFQPTQGSPPMMTPITMGPNEIRNFVERQGFRMAPPEDPYWRSWIRDRYRLKPVNAHLTGSVPEIVAKQLQGEEPVYAKQIGFHPHRWLKAAQHLYHKVVREAVEDVHPKPSDAQREAGNYRMGHIHVHGLPITIEVAKGQIRTKVNKHGKKWSRKMLNHYGYIKRTESAADGDHIDVYVGDHPESQLVFIVNQIKPNGKFDEHKVLIGWICKDEAKKSYLAHYPDNWTGLGSIIPTTMDRFKEWIRSGDTSKEFTK